MTKEMFGIYSANPLFDNNSCSWLLEQLDPYMRIEVDDGDKGQVFYVSVLVDDIPIAEIIDDIVDPQGQGRVVKSLVNAAGDVVNSIHTSYFDQLPVCENYYFDIPGPERDFSKPQLCMRLIAKWREPRIKQLFMRLIAKWRKSRIKQLFMRLIANWQAPQNI